MVIVRRILGENYPASPFAVTTARHAVAEFAARAGAPALLVESIRLAVSEAVTNSVVHGYRGAEGEVHVTAAVTGNELWVLVLDEGCGVNTPAQEPGLGMGMALIARSTAEFIVSERGGGGTEVRMRFSLPQLVDAEPRGAELSAAEEA